MQGIAYHFADRTEAGRMLGGALSDYAGRTDVLVLALPRGGVPVAYEIARALAAPLDIWLVRKLGVPGHEELAMGAMAGTDTLVLNQEIIKLLDIDEASIDAAVDRERTELEQRNKLYRRGMPAPDIQGKTIILVVTALQRGQLSAPRLFRCARPVLQKLLWPYQWAQHWHAKKSGRRRTISCACIHPNLFSG